MTPAQSAAMGTTSMRAQYSHGVAGRSMMGAGSMMGRSMMRGSAQETHLNYCIGPEIDETIAQQLPRP